jgi:Mycotoxin biosynthesis protein UstYa
MSYTLPGPIKALGQDTYSLAVFHQLHCLVSPTRKLFIILAAFSNFYQYSIMRVYEESPASPTAESHGPPAHHSHIDHCFRYLRQSLLCCGDTALEGQDSATTLPGTDGTGAVHMCKDHDEILRWAESRRVVDHKEI